MSITINRNCTNVGMGQIAYIEAEESAKSVLGSCIGLLLYSCVSKKAAFAHIVLAEDRMNEGPAGKYADTALPEMLKQLEQSGVNTSSLVAKVVGGSSMFNPGGTMEIGKSNCEVVRKLLHDQRIRIAAEDTGGSVGRKVNVEAATGRITIEKAGQPAVEI